MNKELLELMYIPLLFLVFGVGFANGFLVGITVQNNQYKVLPVQVTLRIIQPANGTTTIVPGEASITNSTTIGNTLSQGSYSVTFPVVAVTSEGKGVLESATITVVPAEKEGGNLFLEVIPFVEPDTQHSYETAVKVACRLAHVDCSKYNFYLKFNTNATLVGGPSAGAAITLAAYLALLHKKFPRGVAITGTINDSGRIGPVGGVFEKALAAAEAGIKYFFVPKGQSKVVVYRQVKKTYEVAPGFVITQIEYEPVVLNLTELFKMKYNMTVIEVSSIQEIIQYLKSKGLI